jgi:hypothetical protein
MQVDTTKITLSNHVVRAALINGEDTGFAPHRTRCNLSPSPAGHHRAGHSTARGADRSSSRGFEDHWHRQAIRPQRVQLQLALAAPPATWPGWGAEKNPWKRPGLPRRRLKNAVNRGRHQRLSRATTPRHPGCLSMAPGAISKQCAGRLESWDLLLRRLLHGIYWRIEAKR